MRDGGSDTMHDDSDDSLGFQQKQASSVRNKTILSPVDKEDGVDEVPGPTPSMRATAAPVPPAAPPNTSSASSRAQQPTLQADIVMGTASSVGDVPWQRDLSPSRILLVWWIPCTKISVV